MNWKTCVDMLNLLTNVNMLSVSTIHSEYLLFVTIILGNVECNLWIELASELIMHLIEIIQTASNEDYVIKHCI